MSIAIAAAHTIIPAACRAQRIVNVSVKGDEATVVTAAVQREIDALAAAGGGTLHFPAGGYVVGTLLLKSGVTLDLAAGATLLGNGDSADYRNPDPFLDGGGRELGYALIAAVDAENVGLVGAGTIDGRGRLLKKNQGEFLRRPFLVRFVRCRGVRVKGLRLTNPGAWTLALTASRGVEIDGLTIRTSAQKLANNDGIDIDSCSDVRVTGCDIDSGDDAIVLKSTLPEPCRRIRVADCRLATTANAIKCGTESFGGFEDVTVTGCEVVTAGVSGISLATVDGGDLARIAVSNVTMRRVASPIFLRRGARLASFRGGQPKTAPGAFRDVAIADVTVEAQVPNGRTERPVPGIVVSGVPGFPVEDVRIRNVRMNLRGGGIAADGAVVMGEFEKRYPSERMFGPVYPAAAVYLRHARGVKLEKVTWSFAEPEARPPVIQIDVY